MSINHIVTPLDSATLDSKAQYVFYHSMIDFVLKELIIAVQNEQLCKHKELLLFKQYCDLLLYSIETMRIKYMYDDQDNMKVDLTDSGFPNYLEFRYLYNDLELRHDYLKKLPNLDTLKESFLDTLLRKKQEIPKRELYQASSILYYNSAKKELIFNRFVQGKILKLTESAETDYLVSWSFYDVSLNRPFICFMYFNYSGNAIDDYKTELYDVLKNTADRKMALDTMAYAIDRRLTKLSPKYIKRFDLGPLHTVFAKDENKITHTILQSISKKEIPLEAYAVTFHIDEVTSGGEFKDGSFFKKQILQKWKPVVNRHFVFAPHRIIQLLYNKTPELINKLSTPPIEMSRFNPKKNKY